MLRGKAILVPAFTVLLLALAVSLHAQTSRLYVGNAGADDISVIDLNSLKVVGDIKVGAKVHGTAVQADGRRLFTTVESDHTLRVIDTATDKELASIKLTGLPNQCAVTPDGKYAAVPIRDKGSVDIVDVAQAKVIKTLPAKTAHNAFNAGSNRYMFVSSMGDQTVNMIDLQTMEYAAVIPVGGVPRPYVVTPDGRTIYVALSDLHGFVIVDVAQKKVVQRVELPVRNPHPKVGTESAGTLTHGLALTPDGSELWVTSLPDSAIYIYDVKAKKITGSVATGEGPNWVSFRPDGKYACISNADSDSVSIFDVKARREVARIPVGKTPRRLVATNISPGAPVGATAK